MSVGAVAGPVTGEHVPSIELQTFSEIHDEPSTSAGPPICVTVCWILSIREAAWLTRLTICVASPAVSAPWVTSLPPVYFAIAVWHAGTEPDGLYVTNERFVWLAFSPSSTESVVSGPTSPYCAFPIVYAEPGSVGGVFG